MISFRWKVWVAALCFIAFTVNGLHIAKAALVDPSKPDKDPSGAPTPPGASKFVFPWGTNADPTDVPKVHVQKITEGTQKYSVVQGGTMDGRNCRTPMGVGMNSEGAFFQTWESSRSVRMENVGEADVINPWLSNGRNNFRSVAEIVQSAITPDMTDAEKALAIWFQHIRHRHHSPGDNNELGDPVTVFGLRAATRSTVTSTLRSPSSPCCRDRPGSGWTSLPASSLAPRRRLGGPK